MPLPIITDTYLATLGWTNTNAPRAASNHLWFHDTAGTHAATDVYTALAAHVTAGMWEGVTDQAIISNVTVIKCDGVTAGLTFHPAAAAKWEGSGGSDCVLQAAIGVTFHSVVRGPRGRNRIYLPWPGESNMTNGVLTGAAPADMQAAWDTFRADMNTAGYPQQVVSPLHSTGFAVTNTVLRTNIRTQRRRARR